MHSRHISSVGILVQTLSQPTISNHSAGRILPVITSSGKKYLISPLSYCTAMRLDTGRLTTIPFPNTVVTFKPRTNADISCSSFSPSFLWIKGWESSLKRRLLYVAKTTGAMEKINPEKRLTPMNSDVARGSSLSYNSVKFFSGINAARFFPNHLVRALYFIFLCQAFPQETRSHMIYHVIKGDWGRFPQQAAFWIMGPECPACDNGITITVLRYYDNGITVLLRCLQQRILIYSEASLENVGRLSRTNL